MHHGSCVHYVSVVSWAGRQAPAASYSLPVVREESTHFYWDRRNNTHRSHTHLHSLLSNSNLFYSHLRITNWRKTVLSASIIRPIWLLSSQKIVTSRNRCPIQQAGRSDVHFSKTSEVGAVRRSRGTLGKLFHNTEGHMQMKETTAEITFKTNWDHVEQRLRRRSGNFAFFKKKRKKERGERERERKSWSVLGMCQCRNLL